MCYFAIQVFLKGVSMSHAALLPSVEEGQIGFTKIVHAQFGAVAWAAVHCVFIDQIPTLDDSGLDAKTIEAIRALAHTMGIRLFR